MKIFAPEYYLDFKCIADKCKNSCCVGWEIDIDKKSFDGYMKVKGAFGERLKKSIAEGEKDCHFILGEGERCPFLNEDNLCDIYIELGEDALCNICSDHPRFRNFFDSRTEMGLGLCCEAACDLVLNRKKPVELIVIGEDDGKEGFDETEEVFFALREKLFDIIMDETVSAEECAVMLADTFGVCMPHKTFGEWTDIYLDLEIMDEEWRRILEKAKYCTKAELDLFKTAKGQNMQRQLLWYFVYRHGADGIYDGSLGARITFAVLSVNMIKFLCATRENPDFEVLKDIVRRYSAEIEYCEENSQRIFDVLEESEIHKPGLMNR